MEAVEMTLLYDYYGDLLTEKQRQCIDLRYNQDLSLGEMAQELQVSRQGVHDMLSRAEALLVKMEEKTGCLRRDRQCRQAAALIRQAADALADHSDPRVRALASDILRSAAALEE